MIQRHDAILSLAPNASFCTMEDGTIVWSVTPDVIPTENQIQAELSRLQAIEDSHAYIAKRQREYPPMTDYLDGIAKGDQAQIAKYIADCQAVKAKYPKG